MRYYSIVIDGQTAYTSHPNGPTGLPDPGALNVEFDIPQGPAHLVKGSSLVRVWGIGLDAIKQSSNLTGKSISIYGGMGVGLPLATQQAPNSGLLVAGSIYPGFGNWIGLEQTLELTVSNQAPGNEAGPANLVVTHKFGDKVGDVLKTALTTAYPGYTVDVSVSDRLVLDHPGAGFYQSLEQFADIVNRMSIGIFGAGAFMSNVNYPGVQITTKGNLIKARDGQKNSVGPKTIQFYDLLGQPTWLDLNTIQVKTIMRGDIEICDMVTLPPSIATTTAQSNPQLRDNSVFQGTFMVQGIRHIGNFRQPDGLSWNTTFDMVVNPSPGNERGPGSTPVTTPQPYALGTGISGLPPAPNPGAGGIGSA